MAHRLPDRAEDIVTTLPTIELPPFEPPTPEELARRAVVIERIKRLRAEIGSIGIASDDLIHLARSLDES